VAVSERELNGDGPLTPPERLLYLWRNACRNLRAGGGGAATDQFQGGRVGSDDIKQRSPSRFLTDLFIKTKLPRLFPPAPIEMLEVGCGSGSMMRRLASLGYSGQYTGLDIGDRFLREHGTPFAATFVHGDAHLYQPAQPVDFLFSFSALEHIDRDDVLIARLSAHVRPGGAELHIVPAAAGLFVYLWHGYRQYTPADILARFGDRAEIYRLGGLGSLLVHWAAITVPEILLGVSLRRNAPIAYARLVLAGFAVDRVLPVCPSALAVFRRH
jgi:SAM-dependent methyltransferase